MVLRIAICGGGIGGLTAAHSILLLCGKNVAVDVFEASSYEAEGLGLSLGPNALKVLYHIGLEKKLAVSTIADNPDSHIWMRIRRWDTGNVVTDMPMLNDHCYFAAFHRAKLIEALYDAVSNHANSRIHVKKRLIGLERVNKEMKLSFQDGTEAIADLVIGADGIRSVVRSLYVGDTPLFSGFVAHRDLIPMDKIRGFWPNGDSEVPAIWTQRGKHIVTYPIPTGGDLLNFIAIASYPKHQAPKDLKVSKSDLLAIYKDWDPTIQKLINLIEEPECFPLFDWLPIKTWVFEGGRVVLMGDAAHAMLPHNGQGASQSIEDGYSLACCLAAYFENEGNSLEDFMKAYEDCRFPHTTAVQKSSREAADIYSQLGELDAIPDDEERYRRMAKKLETWMIWMWKYDAETEIGNTLKDLRLRVPFAGTALDEREN